MLSVKTDLHTHTIFSVHAYSTIEENTRHAAELGFEAIGITDHFSSMFYPSTDMGFFGNFINYKALPPEWYGVRILHGAEADIVDLDGRLFGHNLYAEMPWLAPDAPRPSYEEMILMKLDYIIASIHNKSFTHDATVARTTEMYCNTLRHPKVLMIGHIGRAGVPFYTDEVLKTAKDQNKLIEINAASMDYPAHITDKCQEVAIRCAELGVSIAVDSDAHSSYYVGHYDKPLKMLEDIHFPEELIANRSLSTLTPYLDRLNAGK